MPAPVQQHKSTPLLPGAMPARCARSIDDARPPIWICSPMSSSQSLPSAPAYTACTSASFALPMNTDHSFLDRAVSKSASTRTAIRCESDGE